MNAYKLSLTLLALLVTIMVKAQGGVIIDSDQVAVNATGTTANSSAILDIASTSKGVLIPRMTAVERAAIGLPAQGLMVYETDTDAFWFYNGAGWATVGSDNLGNHVATQNIAMGLNKITNLGFPTNATDAARKGYVDNHQDADASTSNETITNLSLSGNSLKITEAGVQRYLDLSVFDDGAFENDNGVVRNSGANATDDFVFGMDELPPSTIINDDLFFFDKSKGAFRAGGMTYKDYWAEDSIGVYSMGLGINNRATAPYSVALGANSIASGHYAMAFGGIASGTSSVSLGSAAQSHGLWSVAMGQSTATGDYSLACNRQTTASGFYSIALGNLTNASGDNSFASGLFSESEGYGSTAMGFNNVSKGPFSFALGHTNQTNAYACLSVGRFCDTLVGVESNWSSISPSFVVGNGLSTGNRSNAFVVTNKGDIHVDNYILPMTDDLSNVGSSSLRFDNIYATNGTIQTSDLRAKKNVENLSYGLEEVLALETIMYNWNKEETGDKKHLGVSAQQLLALMPEIVAEPEDAEQLLGVKYAELTPVLISAIQELNEEKEALQIEQDRLADRLSALEAAFDAKND